MITKAYLLAIAFLGMLATQARLLAQAEVSLDLQLSQGSYLAYTDQNIYVDAIISAPGGSASRAPLNLSFVIDRSGSMAGPNIEYTKQALLAALQTLSPKDTFSIVTFGSEVEILAPAQAVDKLENIASIIERIEALGGTALYDALNQGAAQLRRYRTPLGANRMILLSDGPPSRGPREKEDFHALARLLAQDTISISVVGLGHEFNEDILSSLATETNGRYHFAPQPAAIAQAFQNEIAPFQTPIARDLRLEIKLNSRSRINEPLGNAQPELNGNTATYNWDVLYANQSRRVILSGTITSAGAWDLYNPIARATLTYTPVAPPDAAPIITESAAKAAFSSSERAAIESINRSTLRHAYSLEIARSMKEAIDYADQGNLKKALKQIKGTLQDLKAINEELEDEVIAYSIQDLQSIYDRLKSDGLSLIDRKLLTARIANADAASEFEANDEDHAE